MQLNPWKFGKSILEFAISIEIEEEIFLKQMLNIFVNWELFFTKLSWIVHPKTFLRSVSRNSERELARQKSNRNGHDIILCISVILVPLLVDIFWVSSLCVYFFNIYLAAIGLLNKDT